MLMKGVCCYDVLSQAFQFPKAFPLEPHTISTQEAVGATHQVKLSTLVEEAWCYNILFPRSQMLQTDRQTDTHMENP